MSNQAGPSDASSAPRVSVQEFSIRVPKNLKKKHHVMRFNSNLNVDFTQWRNVKMERENNLKEFRGLDEDMPKFGAGSEFNRDLKEEIRRKKYGIVAKKYRPEAQPWILKVGKTGKKFRGIREGGVGENASFYVFTHAPDGAIEAYPLHEWYNFQPIQRYKSLTAEEAEQEFGRRKKVLNYFSLMLRKRLKGDEADTEEPDEDSKKKGGGKKGKELKISEMDEWMDSDEEMSDSDDGEPKEKGDSDTEAAAAKDKKKKKDDLAKKKKKKHDVDDEAFEESDDGDEEGREMDYISDSSESESDAETKVNKQLSSVAEEDALRKLLTSDEDSDEEAKKSGEESNKEDEEKREKDAKETKENKKKKKKLKKKGAAADKKDSSSSSESDSSDSENESPKKKKKDQPSAANSRSASPSLSQESNKRKGANMPTDLGVSENSNSPISTPAKRPRLDTPSLPPTFAGVVNASNREDYGITEDAVRRYLMRKPMTATELLTKFKNKKIGVPSDKLVETMTQILKKINPVKQTIQGKMYLSIKVPK